MRSIPVWALYLRAGPDDPCQSFHLTCDSVSCSDYNFMYKENPESKVSRPTVISDALGKTETRLEKVNNAQASKTK